MGRKVRDFHNPGPPVMSFMLKLFSIDRPFAGGEHRSQPGTKSECFAFRQRLYAWRYQMFIALGDHDNAQYENNVKWLKDHLGPRGKLDWLDLTIFQVEPDPTDSARWWKDPATGRTFVPDDAQWQVVGRFKRPMDGDIPSDPLTETYTEEDAKREIATALRRAFDPPPRPALSVVEPADERVVPVGAVPDFDPNNPL